MSLIVPLTEEQQLIIGGLQEELDELQEREKEIREHLDDIKHRIALEGSKIYREEQEERGAEEEGMIPPDYLRIAVSTGGDHLVLHREPNLGG